MNDTNNNEDENDEREEEDNQNQNEEEKDDDDEDDDNSDETKSIKPTSTEPVILHIKSNFHNTVVDIPTIEINSVRIRDIGSIKKTLSKQLPGKPPIESIRLLQHGQLLREELLIDELMDDDDDEDEDDDDDEDYENDSESTSSLTLVLDMVPPVDPRSFSGLLQEKIEGQSTADLLEAYTLNEAAIWYASRELSQAAATAAAAKEEEELDNADDKISSVPAETDSDDSSSPLITFQLRQYATTLQSQIENTAVVSEKARALLDDPIPPAQAAAEEARKPQVRGHRTRMPASLTAGGLQPSSSVVGLKQTAQHFLNIVSPIFLYILPVRY